jgi:general secretion pathway protein H
MTPTLAPGNRRYRHSALGVIGARGPSGCALRRAARGFTLIELLVVLALVALGAALVTSALPDSLQSKLEEDGVRLAALLESARAQSRATGQTVSWEPTANASFRFVGLPAATSLPSGWLSTGVSAEVMGATAVLLGPEPILPAQRIVLRLEDRRIVLASDGLSAFAVDSAPTP